MILRSFCAYSIVSIVSFGIILSEVVLNWEVSDSEFLARRQGSYFRLGRKGYESN